MKSILSIWALVISLSLQAQNAWHLPAVNVQTIDFETFSTGDIQNDGKPIIISFWATWCSPCKRELNTIAENYDTWVEETGVKLIAVSIDDARNISKVAPYVNGQAWDYEVYLDPNGEFRRAMNVANVPHTFLLNGNREVVWQHNSYSPGDEEELYKLVTQLASGQPIQH